MKPRITYIVNQTTSEMEEQVTLTCEALGDPTPSINWSYGVQVFNEGEQVMPSGRPRHSPAYNTSNYSDRGQPGAVWWTRLRAPPHGLCTHYFLNIRGLYKATLLPKYQRFI